MSAQISNIELWNALRAKNPTFRSHTAEGTAELFSERGFEALKRSDVSAINEFFELSLRVALQKISVGRAKNLFSNIGLVEVYDTPNGGYTQRIAIKNIKPVSPKFKGLKNGDSIDPFVVRKPESDERFFQQNFDYQNFITLQDFQVKTIFISEYGMSEYVSGIMRGLQNGYTIQESLNVKEALNAAINSVAYPLQGTQIIEVDSFDDEPTDSELQNYMLAIKLLLTQMTTTESTGAFNAGGFETMVDRDEYVILQRAGIKDQLDVRTRLGAFHPDELNSGVEIHEIDNFGGITYTYTSASVIEPAPAYPHYDEFGAQDGWSASEGGDLIEGEFELQTVDPNEDVLAIVCQKGLVFENRQNGYMVNPIYNPRGLYTNYWASVVNNAINVDKNYNMVVIKRKSA